MGAIKHQLFDCLGYCHHHHHHHQNVWFQVYLLFSQPPNSLFMCQLLFVLHKSPEHGCQHARPRCVFPSTRARDLVRNRHVHSFVVLCHFCTFFFQRWIQPWWDEMRHQLTAVTWQHLTSCQLFNQRTMHSQNPPQKSAPGRQFECSITCAINTITFCSTITRCTRQAFLLDDFFQIWGTGTSTVCSMILSVTRSCWANRTTCTISFTTCGTWMHNIHHCTTHGIPILWSGPCPSLLPHAGQLSFLTHHSWSS